MLHKARGSDLNSNTLYQLQENVIIAALRRPSLSSIIKGAGVSERHFPVELRPAFQIAMTKPQEEIRRPFRFTRRPQLFRSSS